METNNLINVFEMLNCGNNASMDNAYNLLEEEKKSHNYIHNLITIFNMNVSNDIKLKIIIAIENYIKHNEDINDKTFEIFKDNLLSIYISNINNNIIYNKLYSILELVVKYYFPLRHINLSNELRQGILNKDESLVYYLKVLLLLFNKYAYYIADNAADSSYYLEVLIDTYIPILIDICFDNIDRINNNLNIFNYIFKIFYSSIYLDFNFYYNKSYLRIILNFLKLCWEYEENNSDNIYYYKMKNNISLIFKHFMIKINNNKNNDIIIYAKNEFYPLIHLIFDKILNYYVYNFNYEYFNIKECKLYYNMIIFSTYLLAGDDDNIINIYKPDLSNIILNYFVKFLYYSNYELEFMTTSTTEYYLYEHKNNDPMLSLKTETKYLIEKIFRNDLNLLYNMIEYSITTLTNYQFDESLSDYDISSYLNIIMNIEILENDSEYLLKDNILKFINIILKFSTSNNIYIQNMLFNILLKLDFSLLNDNSYSNIIENMSNFILNNVNNEYLIIKIKVVHAIENIINNDYANSIFAQHLQNILNFVLNIIIETDLENIISSLDNIIYFYKDQIGPHSDKLLIVLFQNFESYCEKICLENPEEFNLIEYERGCENILDAICQILRYNTNKDLCIKYKKHICGSYLTILNKDCLSYLNDKMISLLNILIYNIDAIDEELIFFFPLICYFNGDTLLNKNNNINIINAQHLSQIQYNTIDLIIKNIVEYSVDLDVTLALLGNYIQKLKGNIFIYNDFLGNSFIKLIIDIINFNINEGKKSEDNINFILCIKLLGFIYENCYNEMGNFFTYISNLLKEFILIDNRTFSLKSACIQLISKMLFINGDQIIQSFYDNNILNNALSLLLDNTKLLNEDYELESLLLSLYILLKSENNILPTLEKSSIFLLLCKVVKKINKIYDKKLKPNDTPENIEAEVNEIDIGESSVNSCYNEDFQITIDCLYLYESPFDKVNPFSTIKNFIIDIQMNNQPFYHNLITKINNINEVMSLLDKLEKMYN